MNRFRSHDRNLDRKITSNLIYLAGYARNYDLGDEDAAARLANTICLLILDRGNHVSLLTQRALDRTRFATTRRSQFGNHKSLIVSLNADQSVMFGLTLGPKEVVSLDAWFSEPIWEHNGRFLTRLKLLTMLRDKEGGAHYDAKGGAGIFKAFVTEGLNNITWAKTEKGVVISAGPDGTEPRLHIVSELPGPNERAPAVISSFELVPDLLLATVRQMADEVIESFVSFHGYVGLEERLMSLRKDTQRDVDYGN